MTDKMRGDEDKVSYGFKMVPADEKTRIVQEHFNAIATTYNIADTLLSFGLHILWRKEAMRLFDLPEGALVLDLCGGTGDFAFLASNRIGPGGTVIVYDFSPAMMKQGMRIEKRHKQHGKIMWVQGDAERIAFHDSSFDAVAVGFGIRNLAHVRKGIAESFRILKKGGTLMILEFSLPTAGWLQKVYNFYLFRMVPFLGGLITGARDPFSYLAESIRVFPSPDTLISILRENKFSRASYKRLTNGIAVVCTAHKD